VVSAGERPFAGGPGGFEPTESNGLSSLAEQMALVEADGIEVTGRIAAVAGAILTVACDQECWIEAETRPVTISVFASDALYRLSGPAVVCGSEVTTTEGISIERIQRRKWPRRRLDLAVTLCPTAKGMHTEGVPGRTVDVSIGGLCVETLRPVEGEGCPMVILSLPDGTSIVSSVSTVAAEDLGDGWRYRLAFDRLDSHDASRLAELTAG
jgi:c-di-GMP-binding flagellar brake protein YcgR